MSTVEVQRRNLGSRRLWAAVLIVAAVLALFVAWERNRSRTSDWVELAGGTYAGTPWRLDAREQDGHLCLSVDGPGGPDDIATTMAGACVFADEPMKAGYYYASGPGPGTSMVSYGPLPVQATRIRVASRQVLTTRPLPAGSGLPHGRFWIQFTPYNWPTPADGTALEWAQPLDDAGRPVAFRNF